MYSTVFFKKYQLSISVNALGKSIFENLQCLQVQGIRWNIIDFFREPYVEIGNGCGVSVAYDIFQMSP